jgi:PKD repeat protein
VTIDWQFATGRPASSRLEDPPVVRFNRRGSNEVTLTVTDSNGATCTDSRMITVNRVRPSQERSISTNSTSANGPVPIAPPRAQPLTSLADYRILAINDLGMHCADLDSRVLSILPPFNVIHSQVIERDRTPRILDRKDVNVYYLAASNPQDPIFSETLVRSLDGNGEIYKGNFWDLNDATGNILAFDLMDAFYPDGVLDAYNTQDSLDVGLPVPDVALLPMLVAHQQKMPGVDNPYKRNRWQRFTRFDRELHFFTSFPFGYNLADINWFAADGIPILPVDDMGRENAYPLMRVQAKTRSGNSLGLPANTKIATVDTVLPISVESECKACHTSSVDGGNGIAACDPAFDTGCGTGNTKKTHTPFVVVSATEDPDPSTTVLQSEEWAADTNIVRLHDAKHGTSLEANQPVACQSCHYSPALDLAQFGPTDDNGKQQLSNKSMSNVMHSHHGQYTDLFPDMPPPGTDQQVRNQVLEETCYLCHPGKKTQCLRGAMFNRDILCQDCHGGMLQVGNDFSRNVSPDNISAFEVHGDYYTNPDTPRTPWANEPMCQSCHTGDAVSNLAAETDTIESDVDTGGNTDMIRLLQAWRIGDEDARPIVASNRRFAENEVTDAEGTKQVLYRLSKGHGGVFCEGCHGATHAIWPVSPEEGPFVANDNMTSMQVQGHTGTVVECIACHEGDLGNTLEGPHGMHPIGEAGQRFVDGGHENLGDRQADECRACHGENGQGTVLSRVLADRTYVIGQCKDGTLCPGQEIDNFTVNLEKGDVVTCMMCHENEL